MEYHRINERQWQSHTVYLPQNEWRQRQNAAVFGIFREDSNGDGHGDSCME